MRRSLAILLLAALAGPGACARPAPPPNRPSAVSPPGDPRRGAGIAVACLACHGAAVYTTGAPPFEAPRLGHQRASSIFYALQDYRDGRRQSEVMRPVAGQLDDQQMRDVAAYLASTPLKIPTPQLAGSPAYALTVTHCSLCHGETGLGEVDGTPILTGQRESYLEHALAAYRAGARKEPTMQAMARALSPDEVGLAASYYAAQQGLEVAR